VASEKGLRATRLAVAGAFHSPIMEPAADRLAEALAATQIDAPSCTVMSNVTAQPHTSDPDEIRQRLVDQLTMPVRWAACCEHLVKTVDGASFHELAPGKTLAGMMRRIDRGTKVIGHNEPEAVS
ncbi:MAG: [acyl-carrier-protein] S-malonyltransferase, partial [bacterium]|nr:[acyl-carrier-protein] S-malonyltransferase [bacterium]